ncbi:PAS/PAC sensor hybrid histidine kinase, partial [Candidatus Magnetoovum chiemensis]
ALETAIRENEPIETIEDLTAKFEALVNDFLSALSKALPEEKNKPETLEIDSSDIDNAVAKIEKLLADDDAEAADVFAKSAALLRTAFGEAVKDIERAIQNFDFEKALSVLQKAKQKLPKL